MGARARSCGQTPDGVRSPRDRRARAGRYGRLLRVTVSVPVVATGQSGAFGPT
jgi:hypothetical protein